MHRVNSLERCGNCDEVIGAIHKSRHPWHRRCAASAGDRTVDDAHASCARSGRAADQQAKAIIGRRSKRATTETTHASRNTIQAVCDVLKARVNSPTRSPAGIHFGRILKWSTRTDCKSVGLAFGGSNPSPPMIGAVAAAAATFGARATRLPGLARTGATSLRFWS